MTIIAILSIICNVGLIWIIRKLVLQLDDCEEFIVSLQDQLSQTIQIMRAIDIRGAFEVDDEVGDVFKRMSGMVARLDEFLAEEQE